MKHLDYLDGWRGLAIVFLLIGHFFPVPGINLGVLGVNLFFVLSGLLMTRLLFVKQVPISQFYKRRISRIFPATFFFIAFTTAAYVVSGRPTDWLETFAASIFLNNYITSATVPAVMPFGHIWSLSVEEHSYILLTLIAFISRKHGVNARHMVGIVAILCALVGIAYWLAYRGQAHLPRIWLRTEISAFGIFASALLCLFFSKTTGPRFSFFTYLALAIIALCAHWWSVPAPVRTIIGVGIFALLINTLDSAPLLIRKALSFKPLRQMGIWSFSIYLWQQPFYLYSRSEGLSPWTAIGASLLAGLASYYLIENPARTYLNQRWARNAVPPSGISVTPLHQTLR